MNSQKTLMQEPATERLLEHYRLHGYPHEGKKTLAEADIRRDIHQVVRDRIGQLTKVDPYYLNDTQRTELRMVGSMASQFGIQSRTNLEDIPLTQEESAFLEDIEQNPPPVKIEDLEQYLARYNLPEKEGLSSEVRLRIARLIMIRYVNDAKIFLRILTSPIVQNFLTEIEYQYIMKYVRPEIREQLLYRFMMHDDFASMDDHCRRLMLESATPQNKELKDTLHRIIGTGKNIQNLSQETRTVLMRYIVQLEDEKLIMALFNEYPDADTLNTILQVSDEKRNKFILKNISQLTARLSLEERRKVSWQLVFGKITEPSVYFVELLNRVPNDLEVAAAWEAIIDATIAQKNERYIQHVLGIVPKYDLAKVAYTKLFQAAHI